MRIAQSEIEERAILIWRRDCRNICTRQERRGGGDQSLEELVGLEEGGVWCWLLLW